MRLALVALSSVLAWPVSAAKAKPQPSAADAEDGRQDQQLAYDLCAAANEGDLARIRGLIAQGADPNGKEKDGYPVINCAIEKNQPAALKLLLASGADRQAAFEKPGGYKTPPIAFARNMEFNEIVQILEGQDGSAPAEPVQPKRGALKYSAPEPAPQARQRERPGNLDEDAYNRMREAAGVPTEKKAPAARSDVDAPKKRGASRPDDFALVIGIEDYQSLPKADYGARDAQAVRKNLEALGIPARNIISLEGSAATGNKLKSYLEEWLPLNVKAGSTLWVFYSGHGAPDPKTGQAYLVPWDGDPQFLKSTALPLKTLYADLAKTKAKRVIVALDACFSGAGGRSVLAKGARPLVTKVDQGPAADQRITIFAAASGDQITGTLDEEGHGMFTYFFLKGLGEGRSSAKALFDYLNPKVQDEARRQNREQTPALIGADAPL